MGYHRYVAIGDSQTEGLNDGDELIGYRGWADRLADQLATQALDFTYANLAVRGKLAHEVSAQQLEPALALRPDLVTVMAGLNDVIRPSFSLDGVVGELEHMYATLSATGAHVVTFTFPDIAKIAPLARSLRPRVLDLNSAIRDAAVRHRVTLVDAFDVPVICDPRLWSSDRIHAAPLGHALIAAATAHAIQLPGSDDTWKTPLPLLAPRSRARRAVREIRWAATFLGPWVVRRVRRTTSGAGRSAKRPTLLAVERRPYVSPEDVLGGW